MSVGTLVRTFLQVAAGAADIPVTRLLGQSPAGLSATGDSDTRNYYDMIAARQELDLRPQLERLDRLILRSEGIDPGALTFAFRPLWQMDAPAKAALALSKAQATQIYAGLNLWPAAVTARLVEAQLAADGTYPNAAAVFAEAGPRGVENPSPTLDFDPAQPRDPQGRWTEGAGEAATAPGIEGAPTSAKAQAPHPSEGLLGLLSLLNPIGTAHAQETDPAEKEIRDPREAEASEPSSELRISRYMMAEESLRTIDPNSRELGGWKEKGYVPTETDIARVEAAARKASIARTCDFLRPIGQPIGQPGSSTRTRLMPGGLAAAQQDYNYLSAGGTQLPMPDGSRVSLPGAAGFITLRPITSTPGSPAIDINIPGIIQRKLHYESLP